jgi:hypothetical protein
LARKKPYFSPAFFFSGEGFLFPITKDFPWGWSNCENGKMKAAILIISIFFNIISVIWQWMPKKG